MSPAIVPKVSSTMKLQLLFLAVLLLASLQASTGQWRNRKCQELCDDRGPNSHCIYLDYCWQHVPECEVNTIVCFASKYNEPGLKNKEVIKGNCSEHFVLCDGY